MLHDLICDWCVARINKDGIYHINNDVISMYQKLVRDGMF